MRKINELTIEQKVGQLMMIGWQTSDVNDIVELIKNYHFGNVILFTRNIKNAKQLKEMTAKIQEAAMKYNGIPAFISLDQEGGSVRRVYDGVTNVPGHMAIGAASYHHAKAAFEVGKIIGSEMKDLGVNFVLAPIADINNNAQNPIIAIRAFSDDPFQVSKLAKDFSDGLQSEGVMSSYKHFIGHGNVNVDSHKDLPYLNSTLEDMYKVELIPYLNQKLPDAIMSSHILYKSIDDRFPASISKQIISSLLRDKLGFQGLVVTDCFEMNAILRAFSLSEAAVYAIEATTDIITISHSFGRQQMVWQSLIDAIKQNKISEQTLNRALNRILYYKEKYSIKQTHMVDYQRNKEISEHISLTSITLANGEIFDFDNNTVVVGVTNYVNSIAEDTDVEKMDIAYFLGEKYGIDYVSIDNKNINVHDLVNFMRDKKVILGLTDSHLTLVQRVLYTNALKVAKKLMLISLRTPYDVLGQEKPDCHICLYEYTNLSLNSLLKVLKSKQARGNLPVKLNDKDRYKAHKGHLMDGIINYIDDHFSNNLTLEHIGEEFYVSGGYVSYLFKEKLGTTFIKYLNNLRINKAKDLLVNSHYRVYEISNLCGFQDNNYFTKIFKKHIGVTPKVFREKGEKFDI